MGEMISFKDYYCLWWQNYYMKVATDAKIEFYLKQEHQIWSHAQQWVLIVLLEEPSLDSSTHNRNPSYRDSDILWGHTHAYGTHLGT